MTQISLGALLFIGASAVLAQDSKQTTFRDCAECPEMIALPAGKFMMGSPTSERDRDKDEQPLHEVAIRPFAVSRLEITFAQWDACVTDRGCSHTPSDERWGRGTRPVINVSWSDAREYVQWLSRKTGKDYRLPSEAEWEYAARAGTATRFYWGDADQGACDYANVRSDWLGCGSGRTAEAGARKPNAFGLHDMAGNVWEWTDDCYRETYQGAPGDGSVWAQSDCKRYVVRGGAWDVLARESRTANRNPRSASDRNYTIGFRVARGG